MANPHILKQLPPRDLLITRPDQPLEHSEDAARRDQTNDPKEKPKKGQAYENLFQDLKYTT